MTELQLLLITAAFLGFFHTITGPDHYVPFIALSKARKWSQAQTMWITFISGVGHVMGSVILGIIGIALGVSLSKLEFIEAQRGNLVSWMLLAFGIFYTIYGLYKFIKKGWHFHLPDFMIPRRIRRYQQITMHHSKTETDSSHQSIGVQQESEKVNITPWILFLIFVFGPCEVLIPLLIFPASELSTLGIASVSIVFGVATVVTMLFVVFLGYKGTSVIKTKNGDRYFHLIAGLAILFSGIGMQYFGW